MTDYDRTRYESIRRVLLRWTSLNIPDKWKKKYSHDARLADLKRLKEIETLLTNNLNNEKEENKGPQNSAGKDSRDFVREICFSEH